LLDHPVGDGPDAVAKMLALPLSITAFAAMLTMPFSEAVCGTLIAGAPAPNNRSISLLSCSGESRQMRCAIRGSPGSSPTAPVAPLPPLPLFAPLPPLPP
jgi:hypothetical protein